MLAPALAPSHSISIASKVAFQRCCRPLIGIVPGVVGVPCQASPISGTHVRMGPDKLEQMLWYRAVAVPTFGTSSCRQAGAMKYSPNSQAALFGDRERRNGKMELLGWASLSSVVLGLGEGEKKKKCSWPCQQMKRGTALVAGYVVRMGTAAGVPPLRHVNNSIFACVGISQRKKSPGFPRGPFLMPGRNVGLKQGRSKNAFVHG